MCLILSIEASAAERKALAAAAQLATRGTLRLSVDPVLAWPGSRTRAVRASISEDATCACSLLTDEADWRAPAWDMRPDALEPLAQIFEVLAEHGPARFTVQALWVGDTAQDERHVTGAELADLARRSELGTRTRYLVERSAN